MMSPTRHTHNVSRQRKQHGCCGWTHGITHLASVRLAGARLPDSASQPRRYCPSTFPRPAAVRHSSTALLLLCPGNRSYHTETSCRGTPMRRWGGWGGCRGS